MFRMIHIRSDLKDPIVYSPAMVMTEVIYWWNGSEWPCCCLAFWGQFGHRTSAFLLASSLLFPGEESLEVDYRLERKDSIIMMKVPHSIAPFLAVIISGKMYATDP